MARCGGTQQNDEDEQDESATHRSLRVEGWVERLQRK
jgi:hypothetical protein